MIKFKDFLLELVSNKQISDLEIFADRILKKFDIDVSFSKHFVDRVNDSRNNPDITISELQKLFKKIEKHKGKRIKELVGDEAVLKDLQSELNLPIAIKMKKNGEIEVINKTIMRKKNFATSNKVITY